MYWTRALVAREKLSWVGVGTFVEVLLLNLEDSGVESVEEAASALRLSSRGLRLTGRGEERRGVRRPDQGGRGSCCQGEVREGTGGGWRGGGRKPED